MSQSLQLGPLMLPYALVLAFVALALANWAGRRMGRRAGIDAEPQLWRLLLIGVVAARLTFVLQFRDAYLTSPLDILDLRDGGWTPLAGFAAACAWAFAVGLRRAAFRKPLAAAMGTAGLVWALGTAALGGMSPGDARLPALKMATLGGESVALSDFRGKPTVVNLWATWCPPCRREMPVLLQAQAERPDVHFVFVNQGESGPKVQAYLSSHNLLLHNVLLDPRGELAAHLGHRALPTTLFFDARGRLADTRVGELSRATLEQRLASIHPGTTP